MNLNKKLKFSQGILEAYNYLLSNHKEFFVIGQGLWSPWYVGATMKDLDSKYGKDRVIDCPVSEYATTGAAVGASICGYRSMIVHPRIDFMLLAIDQIVTQAAKWRYMFGGKSSAPVTFRGIINRGGEQGAQHSQSLHSWFAHIPGLRVVMPYSAKDARDLMISSVLCDDPVMFIDDRWLYDVEEDWSEIELLDLTTIQPNILKKGNDITIVGIGHTVKLILDSVEGLNKKNIDVEVVDLRVLNTVNYNKIIKSVEKTGHLVVVDGDWASCGMASEIIASVLEKVDISKLKKSPQRLTLPNSPAPTSKVLEDEYYIKSEDIIDVVIKNIR
jgi:acetoin:2,6-dichlorophenolindophenol oxidoreductase subunit beta